VRVGQGGGVRDTHLKRRQHGCDQSRVFRALVLRAAND
jgi:hypothetical protein